jgi:hypothetical protein
VDAKKYKMMMNRFHTVRRIVKPIVFNSHQWTVPVKQIHLAVRKTYYSTNTTTASTVTPSQQQPITTTTAVNTEEQKVNEEERVPTPEELEQERKEKEARKKRRLIILGIASLLGVFGYGIYKLFKLVSDGTVVLTNYVQNAEMNFANNSHVVVEAGGKALYQGLDKFLQVLNTNPEIKHAVENAMGEFQTPDQIRLINSNFIQLMSHRLYFLCKK